MSLLQRVLLPLVLVMFCGMSFANEELFQQARVLQRNGKYNEAIATFKDCLLQPVNEDEFTEQQVVLCADALVQLMNTFQSKGDPETCITTLQEVFNSSPLLQKHCLRDCYAVMGYALSRTEKMKEAEEAMLKVFTLPLHYATPERYFRDYAYAAAVFYSNPNYQSQVIDWCQEALSQAELCDNLSGKQWVTAMLGTLYKRNGHINKALDLYQQSKEEAELRGDELGVLNSLHALIDLFLYWNVPEYANIFATEAVRVEEVMAVDNPMISAQTYINKGRALQQLGEIDSVFIYTEKARELCRALPYNSGMVDVDLLHGAYLIEKGGDSLHLGIQELQQVVRQGTAANRAKAYHKLAQTYLSSGNDDMAEIMLDNMYLLLNKNDAPLYIQLDYQPVLEYYLKNRNLNKVEQYTRMMLREQQVLKEKRLNFNLVEAIVKSQTEQQRQELRILQLEKANQRLWFCICVVLYVAFVVVIVVMLYYQKRHYKTQMKKVGDRYELLVQEMNQTNAEKEMISQEIDEIMSDKDSRQELETLAPSILHKSGESRFRQRFELLYPLFLSRLRERVPSISRREELLSMLIVLKQDNREIAELLAIAPRSVLMLRHRFRQKIGLEVEHSLENFIEDILGSQTNLVKASVVDSDMQKEDSRG